MKKLWFFLLVFAATGAWAEGLNILKASAPEKVPFAQPFTATVVLAHPQGQTLMLAPESVGKDFAVTDLQLVPNTEQSTQAQLTVMPFAVQKSTFTATFALAANPSVTASVEIPLTVTPVQLFKDNEFKEIRPPHHPFDWVMWLCILLALLVLVGLIIGWVRHIKQKTARLSALVDNRPAHVIALSQIDAMVNSGLWENKQYKMFYITLTDILRTYLQRGFGLDVSADTSAELLALLKMHLTLSTFLPSLRAFLASGDLVKFAKAVPTEQARNQDITILREFITQTAPKPAPEVPARMEVKL